MQHFQDTFETQKILFFNAFLICMTVPLISQILCLTFQCIISSLSSAFRELIGEVSPLHTYIYIYIYIYTHKRTYINFHLLRHWTSPKSQYILYFLVAFIKDIRNKKVARWWI